MKTMLFTLLFTVSASGVDFSVVFDNHPPAGIPLEAQEQQSHHLGPIAPKSSETLSDLVGDSIKTIRIRYFSQETWTNQQQVTEYVRGLLKDDRTRVFNIQIWSEGVGVPEIECYIDFTNKEREKLLQERKPYHEGELLVWQTEACYRDPSGKWWFVSLFDYFHRHDPHGNRELSREKAHK